MAIMGTPKAHKGETMIARNLTALMMMSASAAMAAAPIAAVPVTEGKANVVQPQSNVMQKTTAVFKSVYTTFSGKTEVGFYGLGGSSIQAANEYAEVSYQVLPGFSVSAGASARAPSEYYYGLVNVHSDQKPMGLEPSVHVGYTNYTKSLENSEENDQVSGLLCGMRLAYHLNPSASVDMVIRTIGNGFDMNRDVHGKGSLGIRIYL